jgi:hypothetical protein
VPDDFDRPDATVQPWPRSPDDGFTSPGERRDSDEFGIPFWVGRVVLIVAIGGVGLFVLAWVLVLAELLT